MDKIIKLKAQKQKLRKVLHIIVSYIKPILETVKVIKDIFGF